MGKQDIVKHCHTQGHQDQARSLQSQTRIRFDIPESNEILKRMEAELKIAVLTASSNIPMAFHDRYRLSPTLSKVFPDSGIARKYHFNESYLHVKSCCGTYVSGESYSTDQMHVHPYSLSTDGSNDTGLQEYMTLVKIVLLHVSLTCAQQAVLQPNQYLVSWMGDWLSCFSLLIHGVCALPLIWTIRQ